MKSGRATFVLVLLNLGLIALVGYLLKTRPAPAEGSAGPGAVVPAASEPRLVVKGAAPKVVVVTNEFSWTQLETEDYRTYIARLRAIGCPEQTIRDLVIADLDKLLAPRVQSLYGRRTSLNYWHSEEEELANERDHREWERQERVLDREKREVIQELLGVDLVRERLKQKGYADYYERRLSFLPEAKRDQVRRVLEKFDDLEQQLRDQEAEAGAAFTAEDQAQFRQLRAQRQTEITALLTPAEREQYELWMSSTANAVRYSLYGMNATEQEFQAVYHLRKDFDAAWDPETLESADDATLARWQQAKTQLDEQVREALGPERFAEYQRGEDPDFHQMNAAVTRFNLPREKAVELYEIKRAVRDARDKLRVNALLTDEQKQQALREMAAESERAAKEVLGERAFQWYARNGQAGWIKE